MARLRATTWVERQRFELERCPRAPADARRLIDPHRSGLGEAPWQRARLLVTELTTNALRHGAGRIHLDVTDGRTALRISVSDEGAGQPQRRTPGECGGFGMHLVDRFADRWGQEPGGGSVWFEVDRPPAAVERP